MIKLTVKNKFSQDESWAELLNSKQATIRQVTNENVNILNFKYLSETVSKMSRHLLTMSNTLQPNLVSLQHRLQLREAIDNLKTVEYNLSNKE